MNEDVVRVDIESAGSSTGSTSSYQFYIEARFIPVVWYSTTSTTVLFYYDSGVTY